LEKEYTLVIPSLFLFLKFDFCSESGDKLEITGKIDNFNISDFAVLKMNNCIVEGFKHTFTIKNITINVDKNYYMMELKAL